MRTTDETAREKCSRYVVELFAPEDEILKDLRREIAELGMPDIYIDAEEGRLLQVLLSAIRARRVVELGTLGGYSAIWMARALPADGCLTSIEVKPERVQLARRFIARAGLDDRVEIWEGVALDLLDQLAASGPFDAVFIDADKQSYPRYLEWSVANIRSGGLVIGDNAFKGGQVLEAASEDPAVIGIREFNRMLAEDPRLTSIIVPTRDGVAIAVVNTS